MRREDGRVETTLGATLMIGAAVLLVFWEWRMAYVDPLWRQAWQTLVAQWALVRWFRVLPAGDRAVGLPWLS